MPTLLVYYPPKEKRWSVEVQGERFLIGRNREAEVCIPHPSVSKKHVLVEKKGSRYLYRDLGSKNGVFLNGFRVDQGDLDDGDELRVGSLIVTFFSEKPPTPPPAPSPPLGGKNDEAPALADGVSPALSLAGLEKELEDAKDSLVGSSTIRVPIEQAILLAGDAELQEEPKPSPEKKETPQARPPSAVQRVAEDRSLEALPLIPAAGPRRLSASVIVLGASGCVVLGILLGYIGGKTDLVHKEKTDLGTDADSRTAEPPAESSQAPSTVESPVTPAPLSPPASLDDAETACRVCVRLYLDLVGRPPLRKELKGLVALPREKLWDEISSKAPPAPDPPPEKLGETFECFMGRKPTPEEHAKLREASRDDASHYAFEVGTSRDYAGAAHRRKRSDLQMARSLLVDLTGATPSQELEKKTLEAVRLAKDHVASVAKAIADTADAGEVGIQTGERPEEWTRDAYVRLLLRFPTEAESKRAVSKLKKDPQGWRAVLLELASRPEYRNY